MQSRRPPHRTQTCRTHGRQPHVTTRRTPTAPGRGPNRARARQSAASHSSQGAELAELYEVREYLESAAVELFIANVTGEQITALLRHFADSPGHNDNAINPSSAYYEILFTGAGNALLQQLFGSITARIVMMQNLSIRSPGRAEESRREAEQTVAWIEARDSARAVEAARPHIRMAKESALQALRAKIAQPAATKPG
uniref:GntR family transcriptional regulator n=1 Tax=Nocardia abscessus TaxID=120957 RepID=UPI0039804E2E